MQTKHIASLALVIPILFVLSSNHAFAKTESPDWHAFNLTFVHQHILPGYKMLYDASGSLDSGIQQLCKNLNNETLQESQRAFHTTMDAWQLIQNITFGPIEYDTRGASMQFWPDKKNFIGKQLSRLLKEKNQEILGKSFTKRSVAVKGLPAIERILFNSDVLKHFNADDYQCKLLERIGSHVHENARSLWIEWQNDMLPQFENTTQLNGFFEDEVDAATTLLKSIIEPLELIAELKIKRPLGNLPQNVKYKRLESWRTERSIRNIGLNLEATQRSVTAMTYIFSPNDIQAIESQLEIIQNRLAKFSAPIEQSIQSNHGWEGFQTLHRAIINLHTHLNRLVITQGIHLGFNSRDGD